ncbi:PREDICTED: LOW QUALITY PROTEIN: junctional adhesion molecule 2 [Chrysochloris asiatica]|uniref:LOW QUALITY PROTEIN: junctional adhesion molecule 2 n=1 Tax=Chrysochloris asiatica TaxID=185453 RepID=A0A9B0X4H9_CHRAS|nr:PREDICTED: LOW QUALITY PROTEIN: junctional adhesion molecule 2 [Chrysochloris asiatica]
MKSLVAPAVPSCEVPNSALSGTVVELRCQDKEGNPAPEYTWFKDGVRLLANPKLGSQSTNSSYTINTKTGTLVILACKYPKKTLSSRLEWKKLGRGVSFVYYQQALQGDFKDRAEMIDFSIRIKNVTRNDAGRYRCEVSAPSEQGQNLEEDTVTLNVLEFPAAPSLHVPSASIQFNTISKLDSGEYSCEAHNSVGSGRCPGKRMQVDDLNVSGIIAAVVVVALVICVCGLGVCYAQRKGYFSKETTFQNNGSTSKATTVSENVSTL